MTKPGKQNPDGKTLYLLNKYQNLSHSELAQKFHISKAQVKNLIHKARYDAPQEFQVISLGTPLDLAGDYMVVGDVHVPATDWFLAEMVARVAEKLGINRLIIAGDLFNQDVYSSYKAIVPPPTWEQERDAAKILLKDWLITFDEIIITMGNHDRRLQLWTDGHLNESDIIGMITTSDKVKVNNYGFSTLTSGGVKWRITHPRDYSKNQLVVANALAQKFQSNIVSFHEHHQGIGWDDFGRYLIVNGGILADPAKFAYAVLDDNKKAAMIPGFVSIKNGSPRIYGRAPLTDWSEYVKG